MLGFASDLQVSGKRSATSKVEIEDGASFSNGGRDIRTAAVVEHAFCNGAVCDLRLAAKQTTSVAVVALEQRALLREVSQAQLGLRLE